MKKIITSLVLAFVSTMVNAEYTIQIPLEQAQGGFLPNGSINIGSVPHEENPEEVLPIVSSTMYMYLHPDTATVEVISGSHPYINYISTSFGDNTFGDNTVALAINTITKINLSALELNDFAGNTFYTAVYSPIECIKDSYNSYNCLLTVNDGAGTFPFLNEYIREGHTLIFSFQASN